MIDWEKEIPQDMLHLVRPETRSKYFPRNPLRQHLISSFLELVLNLVIKTGAEKILDVGSGEGMVNYFLVKKGPGGLSLWGGDYDSGVVFLSQRLNPSASYISLDARSLPFRSGEFELVMMNEVLEHLKDNESTIAEAARVSSRYGIFSVPQWPFYQAANFLIGKNLKNFGEHPDHVDQFTPSSLKTRVVKYFNGGVEVYKSFPWIIALAKKR